MYEYEVGDDDDIATRGMMTHNRRSCGIFFLFFFFDGREINDKNEVNRASEQLNNE